MNRNLLGILALCIMLAAFASPARAADPVIDYLVISPLIPYTWEDITCAAVLSDADGDLQSISVEWLVNDAHYSQVTLAISGDSYTTGDFIFDSSHTSEGDVVECNVTVSDAAGNTATAEASVTVLGGGGNNPPVLSGISPQYVQIGDTIMVDLWEHAYDDKDTDSELSFALDQSNAGVIDCMIAGDRYVVCDAATQIGDNAVTVTVWDTEGAWDSTTFVINVDSQPPGYPNDPPEINFVDLDPNHPEENEDITCEAEVRDQDGNLDNVEFRWYVNGDHERTRIRDVQGFVDTASDTLDASNTDEGDEVECRVTVEDDSGADVSESITADVEDGDDCRISIYDLEVEDERYITFRIRNRGDNREDVEYRIYVDYDKVEEDTIDVDEDDSERVRFRYYGFDEGETYRIRVRAEADCGDTDTESVTYTILGGECYARYLDSYRCYGNWLQRSYMTSGCDVIWKNWQYCSQGCSGGSCTGLPAPAPSPDCSLSLYGFEYSGSVAAGGTGFVRATVRNTGGHTEDFRMEFYLDGAYLGAKAFTMSPGSAAGRVWNFYVHDEGTHTVRVYVSSGCGASDSREGTINAGVSPPVSCNYNQVCEPGEDRQSCPYDCPEPGPEPAPTGVTIRPGSMDVNLYKSKVISIDIHSRVRQDFEISVEGVPQEWLDYRETVNVEGDRTAHVFINPKETGKHSLVVRVSAASEGDVFTRAVDVFVTQEAEPEAGPLDGVTGALITMATSIYTVILIIIIAAAIVAWFGIRHLKSEDEVTFEKR